MREPSLLPVFGKLGIKPSVPISAKPMVSKGMNSMLARMREMLFLHGGLALKLSVVAWTVAVLAAVFFTMQA
ncbi:hypothetical protein OHD62_30140 [Mesorhizobium sp. YC-39]|uniref:hypothetical protein n=1 Tax=unclassified Mesorhizobium TaxID=325217 RepID=UPI0021E7D2DE|nr:MULTISPECIES: hypothetical protein [unclassified Mesorhizobium]MCV3210446.1 hypothetical protein [Mesorhizobium sp. YC-2]MCV3232656.1 hypothetical protein [Mesorhizobium sp. YC-39]